MVFGSDIYITIADADVGSIINSPHTLFVIPSSPKNIFALVVKNAQQMGKIASGIFKFLLSLHFSKTISNLPPG